MIYRFWNFDDGPHWDTAFIEASSLDAAKLVLKEKLGDENGRPETVWDPLPEEEWKHKEVTELLCFVMGQGCR